jgi:hypothetical protein
MRVGRKELAIPISIEVRRPCGPEITLVGNTMCLQCSTNGRKSNLSLEAKANYI